jgi:hypothetical protein
MKIATVTLTGASPYSQSRRYDGEIPKLDKEGNDAYDKRNWREHQHYDRATGEVFIPPMAIKNALVGASQLFPEKIPGKGQKTWTKHIMAGIIIDEPVMLGVNKDETEGEIQYCDAQGKKGSMGGTQVPRKFPVLREWEGKAKFYILDDTISKEIFEKYLVEAGKFVGVGRWRPANNGLYGRFHVGDDLTWDEA